MYITRGNRHQVTVGAKTFWIDSNQEEALIRWLESNGFRDKWRRPELGIQVGGYRYTPDAEISVRVNSTMSTRAIVESKPTLKHLSVGQKLRMRKVAKFYSTDLILLYIHDTNSWYQVDIKTGALLSHDVPVPGHILIDDLFMPKTRYGSKAFNHEYRQRIELGKRSLLVTLKLIESVTRTFVSTLFPPPRQKRRKYRSYRRRRRK